MENQAELGIFTMQWLMNPDCELQISQADNKRKLSWLEETLATFACHFAFTTNYLDNLLVYVMQLNSCAFILWLCSELGTISSLVIVVDSLQSGGIKNDDDRVLDVYDLSHAVWTIVPAHGSLEAL